MEAEIRKMHLEGTPGAAWGCLELGERRTMEPPVDTLTLDSALQTVRTVPLFQAPSPRE